MSRKHDADEEVEAEPEGSPVAGACVLVVLGGAALAVVYAVSPDAGIGAVWATGMFAMWRVARRRTKIENHSPPPPSDPSPNKKPQFSVVEDREGHCTVQWQKGPP